MAPRPIGKVASINASLTVALLDAALAKSWEGTDPALAAKGTFTGHPEKILSGIKNGEDAMLFDVGGGKALALELEGQTGEWDVYRVGEKKLVFVEPPYDWFTDPSNHGDAVAEVDALFAKIVADVLPEETEEIATLAVPSGKLAVVYMWHLDVPSASGVAETLKLGGAAEAGDENGQTGFVASLPPGKYRVLRAPVDHGELEAVAAYVVPA